MKYLPFLALGACPLALFADFTKVNPVTGEAESYVYKYVGSSSWTAADWQDSSGANPTRVPQVNNNGAGDWSALLIDGGQTVTASSVEGWKFRLGLFNGSSLNISSLYKWQGGCNVCVDSTSKLTIEALGSGGYAGANFYVAASEGITYNCNFGKEGSYNYYFADEGSVSYKNLTGGTHTIKTADITLSGEAQKSLKHKTLVSYTTSSSQSSSSWGWGGYYGGSTTSQRTFYLDGDVKIRNSAGSVLTSVTISGTVTATSPTITVNDDVGTCQFVKSSSDTKTTIELYYVDGSTEGFSYTPSININFTYGGAGLTTDANVGLEEYAVLGTSWNNMAAENGSTNSVKKVDATGTASVASGVSVTVSGSRGAYLCSGLASGSDLRHGYIDDDANDTTPTITVSGIPFGKYRVVVYHATDTANVQFGYDTINDENYTYVDSYRASGTTSWGSSGPSNSAKPIAEGVNTFVSDVVSGSTLTIVAHRGSSYSVRGGIAAIQIVEVAVGANDLLIDVSGDMTYSVDENSTPETVFVTGNGSLSFAGSGKITASVLDVGPRVAIAMDEDRLAANAVTGGGVVQYNGALPPSGKGWTDATTWNGTVQVRNITNLIGKSSGYTGTYIDFNAYGNEDSIFELKDITGWINPNYSCNVPLKISGTLNLNNGYSNNSNAFKVGTLLGDGNIVCDSDAPTVVFNVTNDWSNFTGDINLSNKCVVFGETIPSTLTKGTVYVADGASVSIFGDWAGNVSVEGALGGTGTLNGNIAFAANSTFNVLSNDDEDGLVVSGKVSYPDEGTVAINASGLELYGDVVLLKASDLDATKFSLAEGAPSESSLVVEDGALILRCQDIVEWTIVDGELVSVNLNGATKAKIPDGVTSIGYAAFAYCIDLARVTVPGSVTSIGDWAFYYCRSLVRVTFEGDAPADVSDYAFYDVVNGCEAVVDSASTGWGVEEGEYWNGLVLRYAGSGSTVKPDDTTGDETGDDGEDDESMVQLANTPYEDALGSNSNGRYRIPALAKSPSGVLVALYDCRYNNSGDLPNPIDAAENWSGDNGAAWTTPRIGIDVDNTDSYSKACNFGDPCVLYNPADDRFWAMGMTGGGLAASHSGGASISDVVLYTRGTGRDNTWVAWDGGPAGNERSVKQMILDSLADAEGDDQHKDEDAVVKGILQGPGHGMVQKRTVYAADGVTVLMPAGTMVFPMQYFPLVSNWSTASRVFAVYSTDGGDTWHSTKMNSSDIVAQENCVMELDDGSWYMIAKGYERQLFRSTDYINWKHVGSLTPSAWVQGSCLRIGEDGDGNSRYAACFAPTSDRANVTLRFGRDITSEDPDGDGIAWDLGKRIVYPGSTGGMSYSSLAMLDDSTLGVLLESNGHIYFIREDISDILDKDPGAEDDSKSGLVTERDGTAISISNSDAAFDKANWTISDAMTLTIPAVSGKWAVGDVIRLDSITLGSEGENGGYGCATNLVISVDGVDYISSAAAIGKQTTLTNTFGSYDYTPCVYSFTDCRLVVGKTYSFSLQDENGDSVTKVRYRLVSDAATIFSGFDRDTTYTPLFFLAGEWLSSAPSSQASFDWTPGSAPSGWFTSWDGEAGGSPRTLVGPDGQAGSYYVTYHDSANDESRKWIPYNKGLTSDAMDAFTFATYGSADMVKASAGRLAVLWCMGWKSSQKTALVKDEEGNIKLVQVSGTSATAAHVINAGKVKGYHLFTVRFSEANGASLQIDDGEVFADASFTQKSDSGFQVGSVLGSCSAPFERGVGFAVLKMLAYPTDELPAEQYEGLCAGYPAVETMDTLKYEVADGELYLPSLTLQSPGALRVLTGTLVVPAGVDASLSALEFGDTNDVNVVFGMNLDGRISINTASSAEGNAYEDARTDCNNGRGVMFGEWSGTGTINISGEFDAPNTVVDLCRSSISVATTIDGGVFTVKGVTARHNGRASLILKNGGTLNLGLYPSAPASITKTYGLGTVTGAAGWTDADAITLNGEGAGTTFLADGIALRFTGAVAGSGNVTIDAPNGGSVEFADFRATGDVAVASGTLRLPFGSSLAGSLSLAAGATLDITSDDSEFPLGALVLSAKSISGAEGALITINGAATDCSIADGEVRLMNVTEDDITHDCVLRISEIMPKPTDAQNHGALEGMDVNGLESGWVELENTSDKYADLADYRFIRVNRGKKTDPAGFGNFPSRLVPPHSRTVFYTSERYSNSKDKAVSAFVNGTFDGRPLIFGDDLNNILVWGDKVNPKKSPYVRLYHMPDAATTNVVDTVVVPSDLPEGWSIIVGDAAPGEGTRRWMCPTPTRAAENPDTAALVRIGPNVGPLYEKKGQKKTDLASEFAAPTPPATPGEDYVVTLPINPVMNPDGSFKPRPADKIASIKFVFRKDLDDSTLTTNDVDVTAKTTDANWGDQYYATIPATCFPPAGHLIQWKVLITDGEGTVWTSPSFNNPDDGYEWYGTIVEPGDLNSPTLPTWHLFADAASVQEMDYDITGSSKRRGQDLSLVPNYARVAIYDSSTSNYYDYVRIDLRGNTSADFTKKGHGLRFAKAHPLTMTDVVTGEQIEEIRKTSLISEFADPSYMRQMIAFWLWRRMGNLVPFDFPVRCNLNGEFYQLAFNSERFTDELIEDVYGLDKFGYGYKNVGTLKSGTSTTAGGIEKKTPDDENETDVSVLESELRSKITAAQNVSSSPDGGAAGLDNAALTKFVVQKFDLPAWLNYLASARITQEMDDVWANVCAYYDNPDIRDGVRGKGTWMPLGYDFNLSFGQWYYGDLKNYGVSRFGLSSNEDWYKSHPLYGGNRVRAYRSSSMSSAMDGNDGFEAVYQSAKFRRLYLRRLRTLMDQELKAPGTSEADTPFMAKMREMANAMRADAALDAATWPNDATDDNIDVWPASSRPASMDDGINDIWDNYVAPRREHLYVTHSVTNDSKAVGYGSNLNAGIPEAQSPTAVLASGIRVSNLTPLSDEDAAALGVAGQFYDTDVIIIQNDNDEVVDMSGWRLAFSVDFTFPAGAVCDANDAIYITADRRAYVAAHDAELTDQVIVGNASFTGAGPVALYDANGELVYSAIPETDELKYLRLHSFYGNTLGDGDTGEWFTLTNISGSTTLDLAGVTVCFLKQGDSEAASHCHITLENKKGKGAIAPLGSMTFKQADWSGKGWVKIQNNKQQITICDRYGSVCQSLKVTQSSFASAYGSGGYLVCDSTNAKVTKDADWHEELYQVANDGEGTEFQAASQAAADAMVAASGIALSAEDVAAGLQAECLKVVAEPVEGGDGRYRAVVTVNPATVPAPEFAKEGGSSAVVEMEEDGSEGAAVCVTLSAADVKRGLWYGLKVAGALGANIPFENDPGSFVRALDAPVVIRSTPRTAPAGFFRLAVECAKPR